MVDNPKEKTPVGRTWRDHEAWVPGAPVLVPSTALMRAAQGREVPQDTADTADVYKLCRVVAVDDSGLGGVTCDSPGLHGRVLHIPIELFVLHRARLAREGGDRSDLRDRGHRGEELRAAAAAMIRHADVDVTRAVARATEASVRTEFRLALAPVRQALSRAVGPGGAEALFVNRVARHLLAHPALGPLTTEYFAELLAERVYALWIRGNSGATCAERDAARHAILRLARQWDPDSARTQCAVALQHASTGQCPWSPPS